MTEIEVNSTILLPTDYHEITIENEQVKVIFNRDRFIKDYVRPIRNNLLTYSDWSQLPDSPLSEEKKEAWANYRQALRDFTGTIPNDINSVDEIVFPERSE